MYAPQKYHRSEQQQQHHQKWTAAAASSKIHEITHFREFYDGREETLSEQVHVDGILDLTQMWNYVQTNLYEESVLVCVHVCVCAYILI